MKTGTWQPDELAFLKANYADNFNADLAAALGRSVESVHNKWHHLGLKKSPDLVREAGRMSSNHPNVVASRWKKGQPAHNKGQQMSQTTRAKVSGTWFQKGNRPHNTKTRDGTLSKRSDGYWHVRVSLGVWRPYHAWVWEQTHGPIPAGHIVIFKNGSKDDCRLDNLTLISRVEHIELNRIQRYPQEVRDLMRTLKKFKKLIYEKQHRGRPKSAD